MATVPPTIEDLATWHSRRHRIFPQSMDWFKGLSKPETIDFSIKYGAFRLKFFLKPIHWQSIDPKICRSHVNLAWFNSSCGDICQIGLADCVKLAFSEKLPSFQPHSGSWEWNQHLSQTSPMQSQPFWVKKMDPAAISCPNWVCNRVPHHCPWQPLNLVPGNGMLAPFFFAPGLYQSSALSKY